MCFIISTIIRAQTIRCSFPSLSNQKVKFGVFDGFQSRNIDSVIVGANGIFSFNFPTDKPRIGYLITEENKPYFLILDKGEQISLKGEYLSMPETIKVLSGKQNQAFSQYASEHPKREQTLSAWRYLDKIYTLDSLFSTDKKTKKIITKQFAKIKK